MSKTVLITGASSGLGKELAKLYARDGYNLVLVSRRQEKLNELKAQLLNKTDAIINIIACDLSLSAAAEELFNEVISRNIQIDILVHNSGMGVYGAFSDNPIEELIKMEQLHVQSTTQLTHLFLKGMIQRKSGQLVYVASLGAFFPGPLMSTYFATKAFMLSFAQGLRYELKDQGVKVSVFCPGPFKSEFQSAAFGTDRNTDKDKGLPSVCLMAERLYQGVNKGKEIIIPTMANRLGHWLSCLLPRSWMAHLVYRDQKQIKSS